MYTINSENFKIDKLKLYFGEPFTVNELITVYEPTVGDIMRMGEKSFFDMLYIFIGNPTTFRLQLWEMGYDWNKMSSWDVFIMFYKTLQHEYTQLLFQDFNFETFEPYAHKTETGELIKYLYNEEQGQIIDEDTYEKISLYLKTMFNIFPKVEKAKGKTTKQWIIDSEKRKYELNKDKPSESMLLPLISSCVNHPGFKYKRNELKEVGIVEFMDSVQRLQIYESTIALMSGRFSGMIDTSKIDPQEFNFMRTIEVA